MQESSLKLESGILIVTTPKETSVLLESSNTKITGIKKYFSSLFTICAIYADVILSENNSISFCFSHQVT